MRDDTLGIDHEGDRMGEAVPRAAPRHARVDQPEGTDDLRSPVRQQGIGDISFTGEIGVHLDRIVGHDGDVVAESLEFLEAFVPGDRLAFAVGSPVERAREQQDQAAPPGERLEVPVLVILVTRGKRMWDRLPHPGALVERVVAVRGAGLRNRHGDRQDE